MHAHSRPRWYEDANSVTEDFVLDKGGITARNGQLFKVTENPTGVWINGQCEIPTDGAQL